MNHSLRGALLCVLFFPCILLSQIEQHDDSLAIYSSTISNIDTLYKDELLKLNPTSMDSANFTRSNMWQLRYRVSHHSSKQLYRLLRLDSNNAEGVLPRRLERITEFKTLHLLRDSLHETIVDTRELSSVGHLKGLSICDMEDNLMALDEHFQKNIANKYNSYRYGEHKAKGISSFHLFHDNDVLLFSPIQKDRDYTGGFRFELMTGRLKMKVFRWTNPYKILSYQSVFFGGEGYTPYIRFSESDLENAGVLFEVDPETGFPTQASLDEIQDYMTGRQEVGDRPFASFQYIGRGKYRMHHNGIYRTRSFLKLGFMGKNVGENIQAVIHQDITAGSQRVLNWDRQIAQGGRLAFSIEHAADISLISRKSIMDPRGETESIPSWVNVYAPLEVAWGTATTYAGFGLGFITSSFLKVNDLNEAKVDNHYVYVTSDKYSWKNLRYLKYLVGIVGRHSNFSMEYKARRVYHNSMLEGAGFLSPFPEDPLDDEAITVYQLTEADVSDWLHMLEFKLNIRLQTMSLYYKHTRLLNKEFEVRGVNSDELGEFQTTTWYGWGTIGANFYF